MTARESRSSAVGGSVTTSISSWEAAASSSITSRTMQQHGVERFYVWFTDFALPTTLAAFGAEVIDAFG